MGSAPDARHTLALIEEGEQRCGGGLSGRSTGGGQTRTTRVLPQRGSVRLRSFPAGKETPAAISSPSMEWAYGEWAGRLAGHGN